MLPDRLEILVTFAKGDILLKSEAVTQETLTALIREFRLGLGAWADDSRFMPPSAKLYGHLIRPILADLRKRGIKTLVFVPDGPFRTVPLGALNDGSGRANGFLVNEFAVSYAPSLQLLETGEGAKGKPSVLAAGVTVSRPGLAPGRPAFAKLPSVKKELDFLRTAFATVPLVDASFTKDAVAARLSAAPYSIIHLATHGEFLGEAANTFLLTYGGPMSLNRLEQFIKLSRFRNNPVELLFLSACKTAAGDDKAALGLAGIAVKSGARSVVATLWPANDAAAAELVRVFYTELGKDGVSKAEALRRAQVALLSGQQFEHPQMWAPFLLIGDWKAIGVAR
jgi:CHAT domain-containing protein